MSTVLRASSLTVGYRGRRVRENVDVELRSGEMVCLLGRNGAGKSTLLRVLGGLDKPLAGRVDLRVSDGWEELHGLLPRERARRLGVVLPERSDLGLMTARELVNLGRHPHTGWSGRLSALDHAAVGAALEELGAGHLAPRTVASLSDGERQKVMIARALAQEPDTLVLDEPTAALDIHHEMAMFELVAQLAQRDGKTVVIATHNVNLAARYATRMLLLDRGRPAAVGTPVEVIEADTIGRVYRWPVAITQHPGPGPDAGAPQVVPLAEGGGSGGSGGSARNSI